MLAGYNRHIGPLALLQNMGMRQSVLPVSHGMRGGNSRGGASRVTRREQILLSLVLFLGGAVWCFAMYSSGGPQLPDSSKTVQQSGGSDKLAEVVPRRLSDVDGTHILPCFDVRGFGLASFLSGILFLRRQHSVLGSIDLQTAYL